MSLLTPDSEQFLRFCVATLNFVPIFKFIKLTIAVNYNQREVIIYFFIPPPHTKTRGPTSYHHINLYSRFKLTNYSDHVPDLLHFLHWIAQDGRKFHSPKHSHSCLMIKIFTILSNSVHFAIIQFYKQQSSFTNQSNNYT